MEGSPPAARHITLRDLRQARCVHWVGLKAKRAHLRAVLTKVRVKAALNGRVAIEMRLKELTDLHSNVGANVEVDVRAAVKEGVRAALPADQRH